MNSSGQSSSSGSVVGAMLVACLGHFVTDFFLGIWPIFKTMAGIDLRVAGIIAAVCVVFGEGSQLFFGSLSDRGYGKRVFIFSMLMIGAGALFSSTLSYGAIVGLYLIMAVGSGAFHPTGASLASRVAGDRKGLFLSTFSAIGYLGLASSQLVYVSTLHYFNGSTVVLMLLPLIVGLVVLFFYRFPEVTKKKTSSHGFSEIRELFSHPQLSLLYLALVCNQIVFWAMVFILPDLLLAKGYPMGLALGGGHLALIGGGALMMIPSGYLADIFGERRIMSVAASISVVLLYALLFLPVLSPVKVFILLLCLGGGISVLLPVGVAMGTRILPEQPGLVSAFLMGGVWIVSEGVGPMTAGILSSMFTDGGPVKVLAIMGICCLISLYCIRRLGYLNSNVGPSEFESVAVGG